MAGKTAYYEKAVLNRPLRRTTTTVGGANASTTNIVVTASAGFLVGDIIQMTTPGSFHQVTAVPDGTHVTITPATGSTVTTGSMTAIAFSPIGTTIGLFTTAPTDAYTLASPTGVEVTGGSYARVSITQSDASWAAPSGTPSATTNSGTVTFPAPTATWGTVVAAGIFDTAGNLLYWNTLTVSKTVNNGDAAPSFAAGALSVSED